MPNTAAGVTQVAVQVSKVTGISSPSLLVLVIFWIFFFWLDFALAKIDVDEFNIKALE